MCQTHVIGTMPAAVPSAATATATAKRRRRDPARPTCLPPAPQLVPSRTRTTMAKHLSVQEKSKIRKTKGKDASKDLRNRKKGYEAGLKARLAALHLEAKELADAESALKEQRRRMLGVITALTPPNSPSDAGASHHHNNNTQPQAPPPCTPPARNTARPEEALIFETATSNTFTLLLRLLLVVVAIIAGTGHAATSPQPGNAAQTTSRTISCGTAPSGSPSSSTKTKTRAVVKPPRPKLPRPQIAALAAAA